MTAACKSVSSLLLMLFLTAYVTQTDGGNVQSLGDNPHHGHVFPHVLGLDGLDQLECLVHVANAQIDGEVDDN